MNADQETNFNVIQVVSMYPCLYDTKRRYNCKVKEFAWDAVIKALSRRVINVIDIKERWKSLRTNFCRHHKKRNISWTYFDAMMFLEPYISHRSSTAQLDVINYNLGAMIPQQYAAMPQQYAVVPQQYAPIPQQYAPIPQSSSRECHNADVIIPGSLQGIEENYMYLSEEMEGNGEELIVENMNIDNSDSRMNSTVYIDHTYCGQPNNDLPSPQEDEIIERPSTRMEVDTGNIDVHPSESVINPTTLQVDQDEVLLGWDDSSFSHKDDIPEGVDDPGPSGSDFRKSSQHDYNSRTTVTTAPVVKGTIKNILQCKVGCSVHENVNLCEIDKFVEVEPNDSSTGGEFLKHSQPENSSRTSLTGAEVTKRAEQKLSLPHSPAGRTNHQMDKSMEQFDEYDLYSLKAEATISGVDSQKRPQATDRSNSFLIATDMKRQRMENVHVSKHPLAYMNYELNGGQFQEDYFYRQGTETISNGEKFRKRSKPNNISGSSFTGGNAEKRIMENVALSENKKINQDNNGMKQNVMQFEQGDFYGMNAEATVRSVNFRNEAKNSNCFTETAANMRKRALENQRIPQYEAYRTISDMGQHNEQDNFRAAHNDSGFSGNNVQKHSKPNNKCNSHLSSRVDSTKRPAMQKMVVPKVDKFAKKKILNNKKSLAAVEQEIINSCKDLRSLNNTAQDLMKLQTLELQQRMFGNGSQAQRSLPVQQVQTFDPLLNNFKEKWEKLTEKEKQEVYSEILTVMQDTE